MNDKPLISVIIPIYKVEEYLNRCVESVVNQTYNNLEIILVDDGSPDKCPQMCDDWAKKDSRIKVVHKKNGGLSDARNAGLDIAAGDYISFIDSDDWIDLETYSLIIEKIESTKSKIGAFDYIEVNDKSFSPKITEEYAVLTPEEGILSTINNNLIKTVAWNKVYHKDVLVGLRFEVRKLNEDEFFTFHALDRAARIVFIKRQCYYYFQRTSSIMGTYSLRRLDMLEGVYNRTVFVEEHYPNIYINAKICFALCCINHYRQVLKYKNIDPDGIGKRRIIMYRKRVRVHFRETKHCPFINRIAIVVSNSGMGMKLICFIKNLVR